MMEKLFQGVYAAVLSPRLEDGSVDLDSLRALIAFLRERGIQRYAVNGATGEFCLTTPDDLRAVLAAVHSEGGAGTEIVCGIGAAGIAETKALLRVAEEAQVQGLLLPMPYFFPYSQDDLFAFCSAVAAATPVPILLYNLPQFTSGLEAETVCRLIEQIPTVVGIKDSSGSLDIVTALTRRVPQACRIVGNDGVLADALRGGLCDGVVSGVACALPELIFSLFHTVPKNPAFSTQSTLLDEFIDQLNVFPTPWGLKWAVQARNVLKAHFSLPLSRERLQQAAAFDAWLQRWLPNALAAISTSTHV